MRFIILSVLALALAGCSIIYKLPTRQGNVIEQSKLDQLQVGMTRKQVVYLMGTPLAASPFDSARWDYLGYYKTPRGKVSERIVSIFFNGNRVSKMKGIKVAGNDKALETPDTKTLRQERKKDETENSRIESQQGKQQGIKVTPPS